MIDFIEGYWIRFLNACGVESFSWLDTPGMIVVMASFVIVLYAFYKATVFSIWPNEPHNEAVKMSIFDERVVK